VLQLFQNQRISFLGTICASRPVDICGPDFDEAGVKEMSQWIAKHSAVQLGRLMALLALKLGCRGENNLAVQGRYGEYGSNELQLRKQKMVMDFIEGMVVEGAVNFDVNQ
jgi:hypothetical protein